jgi:hypothetical protein
MQRRTVLPAMDDVGVITLTGIPSPRDTSSNGLEATSLSA